MQKTVEQLVDELLKAETGIDARQLTVQLGSINQAILGQPEQAAGKLP